MTRDELYRFYDVVQSIKNGNAQPGALAPYSERQIADAIHSLILSAVAAEREECAALAEFVGEPSGQLQRGEVIRADPQKRATCAEIAQLIRARL